MFIIFDQNHCVWIVSAAFLPQTVQCCMDRSRDSGYWRMESLDGPMIWVSMFLDMLSKQGWGDAKHAGALESFHELGGYRNQHLLKKTPGILIYKSWTLGSNVQQTPLEFWITFKAGRVSQTSQGRSWWMGFITCLQFSDMPSHALPGDLCELLPNCQKVLTFFGGV